MKRALLVGLDTYDGFSRLQGCVNDVNALQSLLARNDDDSPNFQCQVWTTARRRVERRQLLEAIDSLLSPGADVALFYFAGHGKAVKNDVVLVTEDGDSREAGVAFAHVLGKVQASPVGEVIVLLDCCFAGGAGGVPQLGGDVAAVRKGVSILAASRADQPAAETSQARGAFSTHLCAGLEGGAADVLGQVTIAGLYSYLSESFGPWEQRPMLKANLDRLHELRLCTPAVPKPLLRRLSEFFPQAEYVLPLDPSYESDAEPHVAANEEVFGILQRFRAAKLLEPVGEEHMYYAAMNSTGCQLTPLGRHYWHLAKDDLI